MKPSTSRFKTIDVYIKNFPKDIQKILQEIRQTINAAAPQAEEAISYGIPAFKLHGKALVFFGAWKHHIGLYATPKGNEAFAKELSAYKQGKGSVLFPLDKPMPLPLIRKIVKYRLKEVGELSKKKVSQVKWLK